MGNSDPEQMKSGSQEFNPDWMKKSDAELLRMGSENLFTNMIANKAV